MLARRLRAQEARWVVVAVGRPAQQEQAQQEQAEEEQARVPAAQGEEVVVR
jgi:hypothetical protein